LEEPRRHSGALDGVRLLIPTAVVPAVLRADQLCLGASDLAPRMDAPQRVAARSDAPVEVVGGQKGQAAPEVSELTYDPVDPRGDVLLVAREDDQVVRAPEQPAGPAAAEVRIREVLDLAARPGEPVQEPEVVVAEVG